MKIYWFGIKSIELTREILLATKDLNIYSFKDELFYSAISIPSYIADGYERQSAKEYIRFLYIANGSCVELRTQLYLLKNLKLLAFIISEKFMQESKEISVMLYSLIQKFLIERLHNYVSCFLSPFLLIKPEHNRDITYKF